MYAFVNLYHAISGTVKKFDPENIGYRWKSVAM